MSRFTEDTVVYDGSGKEHRVMQYLCRTTLKTWTVMTTLTALPDFCEGGSGG